MKLDHARELKLDLIGGLARAAQRAVRTLAAATRVGAAAEVITRGVSVGVAPRRRGYHLAVRVQQRALMNSTVLDEIIKKAKGEADVRYVGRVSKAAARRTRAARTRTEEGDAVLRQRCRPLRTGCSVGHYRVTAGAIAAFVRLDDRAGSLAVLSNNHVLADENRARRGDAILQPGRVDGGQRPRDVIGTLERFVRLSPTRANVVDAAVARLSGREPAIDAGNLGAVGTLAGLAPEIIDAGARVAKIGRTSGVTYGRIVAFELDNVAVEFDAGVLRFDDQLEIEGEGGEAFSAGGDSGALIVTADDRRAVGMLFAGGDHGGAEDSGLSYANPIHTVLKAMKATLVV